MIIHYSPEQDQIIRAMVAEGKSATEAGKVIGRSQSAMVRRAHKLGIAFHAKSGTPKSNVIKFPEKKRKYVRKTLPCVSAAPASKPLRVISNNVPMMVADWIARNGVRRFERGFKTDYWEIKDFLAKHGVALNIVKNEVTAQREIGRPVRGWAKVWRIVDEFRLAEGLEPVVRERRMA